VQYLLGIWHMAVEAAPWLLLGFIAAAMVRAWVPTAFISRQIGQRSFSSIAKASVLGIPLPLCSCGVLPAALGLRRQGASRPATVSFLVSTPEIGFDSFMLSYVLLGPFLAITRPIAALITSLVAGVGALLIGGEDEGRAPSQTRMPSDESVASCCGELPAAPVASSCCGDETQAAPASSCCEDETPQSDSDCCGPAKPQAAGGPVARLVDGLRYVFSKLLDDIKWWLLGALVIAGVAMAFTDGQPAELLQEWGRGPLAMVVMLVVGIPMYVCATASTPIAAALLVAGVSPGAVMVLLLAGPATNIGSIAILRKELGLKTVLGYLAAISVCSVGVGITVNWIVDAMNVDIITQAEHAGHVMPHWFAVASVVILVALSIPPLRRVIFRTR